MSFWIKSDKDVLKRLFDNCSCFCIRIQIDVSVSMLSKSHNELLIKWSWFIEPNMRCATELGIKNWTNVRQWKKNNVIATKLVGNPVGLVVAHVKCTLTFASVHSCSFKKKCLKKNKHFFLQNTKILKHVFGGSD